MKRNNNNSTSTRAQPYKQQFQEIATSLNDFSPGELLEFVDDTQQY
jgi:hypothetical protein